MKQPPFKITNKIVDKISSISELVGRLDAKASSNINLSLRRINRIRSIQGSLAIEQNTLSEAQITAIIKGTHVMGPTKDIEEAKNACEIYDRMDELNPFDIEDLLFAHGIMTRGTAKEPGMFRSGNVGVADENGNVLHVGTLSRYVPDLVLELFNWVKESDLHMLIKSCVFHYELELIHPFNDGNGRMGRLWNTLLLSKWNQCFKWIPIESIIHDRQQEYYDAINESNATGESTVFIEFMLSAIEEALIDTIRAEDIGKDKIKDKDKERRGKIKKYLKGHEYIMNADIVRICDVSTATANRILSKLTQNGTLEKIFINGHWAYKKAENKNDKK